MYYQQRVAEQLTRKCNRLSQAVMDTYQTESKYLFDYLQKTPQLRGIVQEIADTTPELIPTEWINTHFSDNEFQLPDTEVAAAKVCLEILRVCATEKQGFMRYIHNVSQERNVNLSLHELTRLVIVPAIQYILNQMRASTNALYLVEKYKRRTEWFRKENLRNRIIADTKQSEYIADSDLREYLFNQGIDYPFSTPSSVSGRADIIANTGDEHLLVIEIKLFDPSRNYDRGYIRKGFRQVFDYMNDYNQTVGYLVVFNLSQNSILFQTKIADRQWPPRIEVDHRTIYLVEIDVSENTLSASKRKTLQPYKIEEGYLTSEDL